MPTDAFTRPGPPGHNRLADAASPYLRQHADNPVHWWTWGAEALAEARIRNRPILLSIGYAACHWCHVMAHESFEDERTAAAMNAAFVNIKVDREERPDIDHLYMTALQAMGQRGGWPLTMFLRPDGLPFWGGTYFPPEPRYGQPAFGEILEAIRLAWADGADLIDGNAARLQAVLTQTSQARPGDWPGAETREAITHRLLAGIDRRLGGLNGAPKFPNIPLFRYLWQQGTGPSPQASVARGAVHGLLDAMIAGGIHDQIGGGFARYSTDAQWLAPHFEKMLYDNGQLLELLAFAHAASPNSHYAEAAAALVDWLQREMRVADGFAAALDADSEGEEGRFYVWNQDEVMTALASLGEQNAARWAHAFDVTADGNWEGKTILRRVASIDAGLAQRGAALLLARRETRMRPVRDDKILADWNALAVIGLCRAATVFRRLEWQDLAETVWQDVERRLGGPDGRLAHAACDGRITAAGLLDDQAAGALAALALFEASGAHAWIARAEILCVTADRWFADPQGGYFQTASDVSDLPNGPTYGSMRPRPAHDGALPSGLAMLAEAQARLFHLTGEDRWRQAATATILSMAGGGELVLAQQPGTLFAATLLESARVVVIDGVERDLWRATIRAATSPDLIVVVAGADADLPQTHPAWGRRADPGQTVAWVCQAGTCSLPIDSLDVLGTTLQTA